MRIRTENLKGVMLFLATSTVLWSACKKDPKPGPNDPNGPNGGNKEPIVLECNYFEKEDRVLKDDPEAPVDYVINCESKVKKNLVVEPGVVIAFTEDASLVLEKESSFKMEGTQEKPIVFTGKSQEKGLWRGVLVSSNKASNKMKHVIIEYAGSKSTSHVGLPKAGLQVYGSGDVEIDNCIFRNNQGNGAYWNGSNYISITNSTFTKNTTPMQTDGVNQINLYNNTNDYKGNDEDYVLLTFPSIRNGNNTITWRKINVPYQVTTRIDNRYDVNEANLVIEPGTEVIMATNESHLRVRGDASISAVGTESEPIIFRGKDDVPASWGHILVSSSSALNEISFVKIQNAGNSMSNPVGGLQLDWGAYLKASDVDFSKNAGYAVSMLYRAAMAAPHLDHSNLTTDNGKLFCKGENGPALSDPNDPDSTP